MGEDAPFRIDAGVLVLRPLRSTDAEALASYRSDPEVARYQSWTAVTLADARALIAAQTSASRFVPGVWSQLAIAFRDTGAIVGDCGVLIDGSDEGQATFGITLGTAHHGSGHATAALRALLRHLFDDLRMHRVSCSVDPRNVASVALMQRLGFREEAHFVESLRFKGEWADDVIFAVLAREWASRSR